MIGWILKIIGIILALSVLLYLRSFQILLKRPQKMTEKIYIAGREAKGEERSRTASAKRALLLYQDSKHGTFGKLAETVAEHISAEGYEVVVNHPTDKLEYDAEDYDILAFGSPAYLGQASGLLTDFIKKNPFTHKTVFIFIAGITPEDLREIEQIASVIPRHNQVISKKVYKGAAEELRYFLEQQSF